MHNLYENIELLADYVEGLLPEESSQKIKIQSENDVHLRSIIDGIDYYIKQNGREAFDKYYAKLNTPRLQKTKSSSKLWIGIAASICFLLLSYFSLQYVNNYQYTKILSQSVETPYPAYQITKASDGEVSKALQLYNQNKFEDANKAFAEEIASDKHSSDLLFYAALSNLYTGTNSSLNNSISLFNQVLKQKNSVFLPQTEWYLSIAYLKNKQYSEAKTLLQTIVNKPDHFKQSEAKILLKHLK